MSDTQLDKPMREPYKTPMPIKMVQDYLNPLNTLYLVPAPLAMVLDILSPFGPLLIGAAGLAGAYMLYNIMRRNKITKNGRPLKRTPLFAFSVLSFLVFSASAGANFSYKTTGGALASWVPKVKTWQDAYLVSIKKDTEEINKKVDKTNVMLAQLLDNMRPQLEKPLVEEIPSYNKLPQNQKNALLLFTKKVGTNGIHKYKGLLAAANTYADNQTPENAREVANHFKYVVRVNGKDIEDTKAKMLIMALFLDPATYDYLTGVGAAPSDKTLLNQFNIDISQPVENQLSDPLGDLIRSLELQNGVAPEQQVVIPKAESHGMNNSNTVAPKPNHSAVKKYKNTNINANAQFM
jgi:hypothetical protein